MIDFIFQVDLSIIYIIHRRDFSSPHDKSGTSTSPIGGKFYYTAAEANSAAREHCQREANSISSSSSSSSSSYPCEVHHGYKDGLYRGGTRDNGSGGGRDRFEVIVRRLQAGGTGAIRGESRGSVMVGTRVEERRRASWSESSGGSGGSGGSGARMRDGFGRSSLEGATPVRNRLSFVGERRSGIAGGLRPVEEEEDFSGTDGSGGSPRGKKRKSLVFRLWGTLRRR